MIPAGVLLLLGGVSLIMFRGRLTRQELGGFGDGQNGIALYVRDQAAEQNLMIIGILAAVLGIGLILVGAMRKPAPPSDPPAEA